MLFRPTRLISTVTPSGTSWSLSPGVFYRGSDGDRLIEKWESFSNSYFFLMMLFSSQKSGKAFLPGRETGSAAAVEGYFGLSASASFASVSWDLVSLGLQSITRYRLILSTWSCTRWCIIWVCLENSPLVTSSPPRPTNQFGVRLIAPFANCSPLEAQTRRLTLELVRYV